MPVDNRIEQLREDYGFTCECERCTAELVHMDKASPARMSVFQGKGGGLTAQSGMHVCVPGQGRRK